MSESTITLVVSIPQLARMARALEEFNERNPQDPNDDHLALLPGMLRSAQTDCVNILTL